MLSYLKNEDLAVGLSAGPQTSSRWFWEFSIEVSLTENGLQEYAVVTARFSNIVHTNFDFFNKLNSLAVLKLLVLGFCDDSVCE